MTMMDADTLTMKNLNELVYIYDREVLKDAKTFAQNAMEGLYIYDREVAKDARDGLRNMMEMFYLFDREVVDEVGDKVAETVCGKHV